MDTHVSQDLLNIGNRMSRRVFRATWTYGVVQYDNNGAEKDNRW